MEWNAVWALEWFESDHLIRFPGEPEKHQRQPEYIGKLFNLYIIFVRDWGLYLVAVNIHHRYDARAESTEKFKLQSQATSSQ